MHDVCGVSDGRCETSSDISERSESHALVAEVAFSAIRRVHRSIYIVVPSLMRAISSRHRVADAQMRAVIPIAAFTRIRAIRGSFGDALAARARVFFPRRVNDRSAVLTTCDAGSRVRKSHCPWAPERISKIKAAIETRSIRMYRAISWLIKHQSSTCSETSWLVKHRSSSRSKTSWLLKHRSSIQSAVCRVVCRQVRCSLHVRLEMSIDQDAASRSVKSRSSNRNLGDRMHSLTRMWA